MGATVEQVEIDGMFYCNHKIFKLIARCHSGLGKIEKKVFVPGATVEQAKIH